MPSAPTVPAEPPGPPLIGTPCPGVIVRGHPPTTGPSVTTVSLVIDWAHGVAGGSFDWLGPYYDDEQTPGHRYRSSILELNVADWRMESMESGIRHWLDIEWPPFLTSGLHFYTDDGPVVFRPWSVTARNAN